MRKLSFWLAVVLAPLVLRLLLISDQPYSDDGFYAAEAYDLFLFYTGASSVEGWLLPREGFLALYPLLSSWVYFLPCEPFLLLRAIDAIVAVGASIAVYRFIEKAVGEHWIALASTLFFVIGANHPLFINAGYRNPIMLALFLTASCLVLLQRVDGRRSYAAGMLMACAVLVREFFLPMGIVVSLYAMARGGWSCFLRFAAGGAALVCGTIGIVLLLRGSGGFAGLLAGYSEVNAPSGYSFDIARALEEGLNAARALLFLLPVAIAGLLFPAFRASRQDRRSLELYWLAIGLCLAPLLEVVYKPVHAYHYGQAILGFTILLALGLRILLAAAARWRRPVRLLPLAFLAAMAGCTALLLLNHARTFYWQAALAARFVPVMIQGNWQSEVTDKSFYLRAARAIRENTSPSATVMIAYYARGLIPLSGRKPAAVARGNLSRVLYGRDPHAMRDEQDRLRRTPPDALVLIHRTDFHGRFFSEDQEFTRAHHWLPPQSGTVERCAPYGSWSAEIYLR